MTNPLFVDTSGRQTFPGPVQFKDVSLSAFPLDADLGALQILCEQMIGAPSAGAVRFKPVLSKVVMVFADFSNARFVGNENVGYATERELSFSIPGIYSRLENGIPIEAGFAVFMPFMFLDNPVALMTGREKYGYFKDFGRIGLPRDGGANAYSAEVYGCPHFQPSAIWGNQLLLTLGQATAASGEAGLGKTVAELARSIANSVLETATEAVSDAMLGNLLSGRVAQIFLKQFRDIEDGARACYQAVTLGHYDVQQVKSVSLLDSYTFDLRQLDSQPVASQLGLGPITQTGAGFEIVLDMLLENGRILWQG